MRTINLYTLTRTVSSDIKSLYEKSLSQRNSKITIRDEELSLISLIITDLISHNAPPHCYEEWFYSFSIPQIGKEFDLLRIGTQSVVNLELKSQEVSNEKILSQLIQNQYYLSHLSREIYSFTIIRTASDTLKIFQCINDVLHETSITNLIQAINQTSNCIHNNIETLFRAKDYLISPLSTPDKFLSSRYYLSNQQKELKSQILASIPNLSFWGLKGSAGTGKTLLLYDIAITLSTNYRIGIIHSGILSPGHLYLNQHLTNIVIMDPKSFCRLATHNFDIICVDEAQRIYTNCLDKLIADFTNKTILGCIFSYDFAQSLSKNEITRHIPNRLNSLGFFTELFLTEKIRTNKEMYSFIRNMMRLSDTPRKKPDYSHIDIIYANNTNESDYFVDLYTQKGYVFITYTPSTCVRNAIDHYSSHINSHKVIGQEFDDVLIILDNNFRYNNDGDLEGRSHPNPSYLFPRLFYQNISRTRENLCIIVLDNMELFKTLVSIKENEL